MNIKEFYDYIGGDYEDALRRFLNERLIERFVLKFETDQSYELLMKALNEKKHEESFRAAHSLKGVCANLSLMKLYKISADITEILRDEASWPKDDMVDSLTQEYLRVMEGLHQIQ